MTRVVVWFSCGAASAVAGKLALAKYDFPSYEIVFVYCDTGSEHEDNARFLADCERWYERPILKLKSDAYRDTWEVFEKTRYLAGVKGARCTVELKKKIRFKFERPDDIQVFGFTDDERHRADRFHAQNPDVVISTPLIYSGLKKTDCFDMLRKADIALPAMYLLGYRNNNCIGCVKGQAGYWNKIRRDFPDTFERMAKVERKIGAAICKTEAGGKRTPIYLDELNPKAGKYDDMNISCGLLCEAEA